jgi:hypothetical protein
MVKIEKIVKQNKILISLFAAGLLWVAIGGGAHAATISVAAGDDVTNIDSTCSLSEAIENINAGDANAYPECAGTGAFGTSDTIQLPNGTVRLMNNLPTLNNSIIILGGGMGVSIVSGDSQWSVFQIGNGASSSTTARDFTVRAYATAGLVLNSGNTTVERVEVDGNGSVSGGSSMSLGVIASTADDYNVTIKNVYVHDISFGYFTNAFGLTLSVTNDAHMVANIENVTVEDITTQNSGDTAQGIALFNGVFSGGTSGDLDVSIRNTTIDNIVSLDGNAIGIGVTSFNDDTDTAVQTNVDVTNVTIRGVSTGGTAMVAGGIGNTVAGSANGATVGSIVNVSNTIIASSSPSCLATDITSLVSVATGVTPITTIHSSGGNITDDNTCTPYFTHNSDQNNIGDLGTTLGAMGDNGGFVPTIPLLANSLAVDGGVAVSGLVSDARGSVRPQGSAFDSGAYESGFTKSSSVGATGNDLAQTGASVPLLYGLTTMILGLSIVLLKRSQLL